MKVKYVESVILNLPNFDGSFTHTGGQHVKQYIQWFKTDEDTDFIGLNEDEASALLRLLNSSLATSVKESSIQDIEEDKIPSLPFYHEPQRPYEYELSKIVDCKKLLGFEVKGYIPN
jgi:hypothetical protein